MSAEKALSEPGLPGATPGGKRVQSPFQKDQPAVRLGLGRFTVDIAASTDGAVAFIGSGVGSGPLAVDVTPAAVMALLELADTADCRTVWKTQAWPLAC